MAQAQPASKTRAKPKSALTGVAISFSPQEYSDAQATQRAVALMIERGIRANAVAPGPVWTPLNPSGPGLTPAKVTEFGEANPIGRQAVIRANSR